MNASKSHLVITMGDPAGIGPEVCWKGITSELLERCDISIVGDPEILNKARLFANESIKSDDSPIQIIPLNSPSISLTPGKPSAESGRLALEAISIGTDLCLQGKADAMVTAPVSKEAIEMSGTPFIGHTEWISTRCGNHNEMMMMSDLEQSLHIGYLTTHLPLKKVPSVLSKELVENRLLHCLDFRGQLKDPRPIAICGLNPHAGENGLLGEEEIKYFLPVIDKLKQEGHPIEGPFPADTLFISSQRKKYSIILSIYHDQGGIPFKMLAFDHGVNHTLGLPIIRTSVDHGTAWPIAWQGVASSTSMTAAIKLALIRAEAGWKEPSPHHNTHPKPKKES